MNYCCMKRFNLLLLLLHWLLRRRTPFLDKLTENVYLQFYINWTIEMSTYVVYYSMHLISALFYIGLALYVNAMLRDLKICLRAIDAEMDNSQAQRKLFDAIQFHAYLFELADTIADIMSTVLFFLLLTYAITIAVFMVDMEATESIDLAFVGSLTGLINILIQLVIYCAYSENLTTDLGATGDVFYKTLWYQMPVKLQKLYVLSIARSQREFRLTGLGIIECSLRIFASVRHFSKRF